MSSSRPIAIALTGPPNRYVNIVAEQVAQPGQALARTTMPTKTRPQWRQMRLNPLSAVSPVASV